MSKPRHSKIIFKALLDNLTEEERERLKEGSLWFEIDNKTYTLRCFDEVLAKIRGGLIRAIR